MSSRYSTSVTLTCERCLVPFTSRAANTRWCSRKCTNLAYAERHGQRKRYDIDTIHRVLKLVLAETDVQRVLRRLP